MAAAKRERKAKAKVKGLRVRAARAVLPQSLDVIALAWVAGWKVPDRREIFDWASEFVDLPKSGVYSISGKFNVQRSRYLIEPFRALRADGVRVVVLMMPVRSGKSLVPDIFVPWALSEAPGPIMWNMSTETLAKRHLRTRVLVLFRAIKVLRDLLPSDPRALCGDIIFQNGVPFYMQGPSIDNLQGVPVRYLIESELWRRDAGRHEEAVGRLGDWERLNGSKLICEGQAGIEDDDMDTEWKASTMEEWSVPCLKCGHYFEPASSGYRSDGSKWGLVWHSEDRPHPGPLPQGEGKVGDDVEVVPTDCRDKEGFFDLVRVGDSVRYACPDVSCRHEHLNCEVTQLEWNRRGRYEVTNPKASPDRRGFHVFATCTRSWKLLAKQLAASLNALRIGITGPLQIYTQKRDARSWTESFLLEANKAPTYAVPDGPFKWADECDRVLAVDHQEDGVNWGLVVAMSRKGEFRRLWYGKLLGKEDIKEKAKEFGIGPKRGGIDVRHEPKTVYGWCVENDWIGMMGDHRTHFVHHVGPKGREVAVQRSYSKPQRGDPESGKAGQKQRFALVYHWSNPTVKNIVKGLIDRGRILEPDRDPNDPNEIEYRTQMKGQWRRFVKNRITGTARYEWTDNGNDHARDCWNMVTVFALIRKYIPDFSDGVRAGRAVCAWRRGEGS
jgi:hypothetical protein